MAISIKRSKPLPAGCAVFLGLLLVCGGLALAWFLGLKEVSRAREIEAWDKLPCTFQQLELSVDTSTAEPTLGTAAKYTYTRAGQNYTGTKVYDHATPTMANEIEEALHLLRTSPQPTCYVNPAAPSESVLVLPSRTIAYVLTGLGAMLALLGAYVMFGPALRRNNGSRSGGPLTGFILMLIFAIAGGTCLWFGLKDDWKSVAARMVEAPCTIVSSRVKTSTSTSKGRTTTNYRPDILYRYEWSGRTWHSEWTDFSKNNYSSSNHGDAQDTVRRYPAGKTLQCWVDPQTPWAAVLEKNAPGSWLLIVIGGIFGGIGLLGLLYFAGKLLVLRSLLRSEKPGGPPPLPR